MRRSVDKRRERSGIDAKMTPMIDVIFQLQIFFLCTAGFAKPESILPTELPDFPAFDESGRIGSILGDVTLPLGFFLNHFEQRVLKGQPVPS